MEHGHEIKDLTAALTFLLAGKAVCTVLNPTTGGRFTFKVVQGKGEGAPHFVSVLTGSDNEADFSYLGTIFTDGNFVVTRKSRISPDAPSAKAFSWIWCRLFAGRDLGPAVFLHEGRCGRCGRRLTTPESIEMGLGPVCAEAA